MTWKLAVNLLFVSGALLFTLGAVINLIAELKGWK